MLEWIYRILWILSVIYGLYFVVTSVFAFKKIRSNSVDLKPKTRFKIIVPARNEENVITYLIDSLLKLNYPKQLYSVDVIVNNSTDNTYDVVKNTEANAIKCDKKTNGKGDVLKWVIEHYKNDNTFDAYVIFDADNLVHPDFLTKMNNYYLSGYKVAQGFRDTKNISDSWISSSYALYYYFQNFFFNRARQNLNASASINGTGFYMDKEISEKLFFTTTITEDMEFTGICAINGVKIAFAEEAITFDEQATKFKVSWIQRKRWTTGILKCLKIYWANLIKRKSMPSFDIFMVYLAPLIQIFSFILLIFYLLIVPNINVLYDDMIMLILSYLLTCMGAIFVLKYNKKPLKSCISGIILFIVFIITWIPINVVSLFTKNLKWVEIKHNRQIELKSLIKDR